MTLQSNSYLQIARAMQREKGEKGKERKKKTGTYYTVYTC